MTIALANSSPVQYAGNGTAVTFSYPWKIFASTDLVVGFIVGGVYSQQGSNNYTVSGVGNNGGGSVTFIVAPPLGTTVDLRPLTPEIQSTDFGNLGPYLPENQTNGLDRLTRMVQDLYRLTYTFGIHGPDQEDTSWPALPGATGRQNLWLGFDGNGLPTVGSAITTALTQTLFNQFLGNAGSEFAALLGTYIQTGTFTGTFTGLTTTVTATIHYVVVDGVATLSTAASCQGTSNSTGYTMTGIPAALTPANFGSPCFAGQISDNGTTVACSAYPSSNGSLNFMKHVVVASAVQLTSLFTNTGTKGVNGFSVTYPVI